MRKQKGLIIGIVLVAIILMAIGYASLTNGIPLNITANAKASADANNFKVYFTGVSTKSDETEGNITVTAAAKGTSATIDFNKELGLDKMGESAYVILEIENGSEGIDAESVKVTTDATDTNIFDFAVVMCDQNGTPVTNSENPVDSGAKTYAKVSVTLLTSPTAEATASTTVTITAKAASNVTPNV